ncbi:rhomboid family intramembrane serine protease GlpG [Psychrosphaera saromensis]|nr:rhomboid family intramembrane serine protease GlpG [Psychrosphaera saromensis]GHB71441.1 rhomboid family intramembrane serine protease GlpG [Psychrosphaera saromensis]GLQ13311.1 rhomboid family intramembrane serine protease GlpG [Psychrosphaera saromensis]
MMIVIGELGNKRACQAFVDYLSVNNIEHKVEKLDNRYVISVASEQHQVSEQMFTDFLHNPSQAKFLDASWQVNQPQNDSAFVDSNSKTDLGLARIWNSTGWFTKLITLICIVIYIAFYSGYSQVIFNALSFKLDLTQPYRLFTPILMHLDTLHLVFNITWWWYLGGKIEKSLSAFWLINLTLLSALLSNTAQAVLVSANFAGISGVVYALTGFTWLYGRNRPNSDIQLPNNIFVFLLIWMGLGFIDLLPINMANWAHLFGLIAGLISAQILTTNKR